MQKPPAVLVTGLVAATLATAYGLRQLGRTVIPAFDIDPGRFGPDDDEEAAKVDGSPQAV